MVNKLFYGTPVDAPITGSFGEWYNAGTPSAYQHRGIDFGAPMRSLVKARCYGVVVPHTNDGSFGKSVCVKIDGVEKYALYAHNDELKVSIGKKVYPETILALSGNTGTSSGPHVHWQLCDNTWFPVDISYSHDPLLYTYTEAELATIEDLEKQVTELGELVGRLSRVTVGNGYPDPIARLIEMDNTPNNLNLHMYINDLNTALTNHINRHP